MVNIFDEMGTFYRQLPSELTENNLDENSPFSLTTDQNNSKTKKSARDKFSNVSTWTVGVVSLNFFQAKLFSLFFLFVYFFSDCFFCLFVCFVQQFILPCYVWTRLYWGKKSKCVTLGDIWKRVNFLTIGDQMKGKSQYLEYLMSLKTAPCCRKITEARKANDSWQACSGKYCSSVK